MRWVQPDSRKTRAGRKSTRRPPSGRAATPRGEARTVQGDRPLTNHSCLRLLARRTNRNHDALPRIARVFRTRLATKTFNGSNLHPNAQQDAMLADRDGTTSAPLHHKDEIESTGGEIRTLHARKLTQSISSKLWMPALVRDERIAFDANFNRSLPVIIV